MTGNTSDFMAFLASVSGKEISNGPTSTRSQDGAGTSGPIADPVEGVPDVGDRTGWCADDDDVPGDSGDSGCPEGADPHDESGHELCDLEDSVMEDKPGPAQHGSQSGSADFLSPNPGESPTDFMFRLQATFGIVQPALSVEGDIQGRRRREGRGVVPSVQDDGGGLAEASHGRQGDGGQDEGDPESRTPGVGNEGRIDQETSRERLERTARETKDHVECDVVENAADGELRTISDLHGETRVEPIQLQEKKVRTATVGVVAADEFLAPAYDQKPGLLEPEVYEETYDISPFESREEIDTRGIVRPIDSILSRMGGKSQLKTWLVARFPRGIKTYVEPFGGSFQVLLWKPWRDPIEIINDVDADLVHFFHYVVHDPEKLVDFVNAMPTHEAVILGFREALARGRLSGLERAAAYSISVASSFNAMGFSHGRYASSPHVLIKTTLDRSAVRRVAERLRGVDIRCTSYHRLLDSAVKEVPDGAFYYLDPPYDQTEGYSSFSGELGFGWSDHVRLSEYCEQIDKFGGRFIQTNSDTGRLVELYGSYKHQDGTPRFTIQRRKVYYSVSGVAEAREEKTEIIISNYDLEAGFKGKRKIKYVATTEQEGLFK